MELADQPRDPEPTTTACQERLAEGDGDSEYILHQLFSDSERGVPELAPRAGLSIAVESPDPESLKENPEDPESARGHGLTSLHLRLRH